jgi:hypothetical protein
MHSLAPLRTATAAGIPALIPIRDPLDAASSLVLFSMGPAIYRRQSGEAPSNQRTDDVFPADAELQSIDLDGVGRRYKRALADYARFHREIGNILDRPRGKHTFLVDTISFMPDSCSLLALRETFSNLGFEVSTPLNDVEIHAAISQRHASYNTKENASWMRSTSPNSLKRAARRIMEISVANDSVAKRLTQEAKLSFDRLLAHPNAISSS